MTLQRIFAEFIGYHLKLCTSQMMILVVLSAVSYLCHCSDYSWCKNLPDLHDRHEHWQPKPGGTWTLRKAGGRGVRQRKRGE
jgi:hypothetical protein